MRTLRLWHPSSVSVYRLPSSFLATLLPFPRLPLRLPAYGGGASFPAWFFFFARYLFIFFSTAFLRFWSAFRLAWCARWTHAGVQYVAFFVRELERKNLEHLGHLRKGQFCALKALSNSWTRQYCLSSYSFQIKGGNVLSPSCGLCPRVNLIPSASTGNTTLLPSKRVWSFRASGWAIHSAFHSKDGGSVCPHARTASGGTARVIRPIDEPGIRAFFADRTSARFSTLRSVARFGILARATSNACMPCGHPVIGGMDRPGFFNGFMAGMLSRNSPEMK